MLKLEQKEIIGIAALLIHAAKIDEIYSEKEKKILSFVVEKINDWLLQNKINLMAHQPWRFIKIQNWLCGGFAHTRGTYIILSQAYLDKLSTNWSEKMDKNNEAKLILTHKMYGFPFYDISGIYGISARDNYVLLEKY